MSGLENSEFMEKNIIPRVAAIHDMSGFGKVSLTEAIPILSAMGTEVCPLPTAILSTHTYEFKEYTFRDLTDDMNDIIKHWKKLGICFDAIYSGYLGSQRQIEIVQSFIKQFKKENTVVVVDPVMGDNILLDVKTVYSQRMRELQDGMKTLISYADVITPNLTEVCLLLDEEYPKDNYIDSSLIEQYCERLTEMGCSKVVITSVMPSPDEMYVAAYNSETKIHSRFDCGYVDRFFHGTGDVLASVLTGALSHGTDFQKSVEMSVDFVRCAIAETMKYPQIKVRNGVLFEKILSSYFSKINFE